MSVKRRIQEVKEDIDSMFWLAIRNVVTPAETHQLMNEMRQDLGLPAITIEIFQKYFMKKIEKGEGDETEGDTPKSDGSAKASGSEDTTGEEPDSGDAAEDPGSDS